MSKAYVYNVKKSSSDSHQVSPGWMLTFVRWLNRDPKNYTSEGTGNLSTVKTPMVVTNDCISVTVAQSKSSHTPQLSAILKGGDINYLTAVAPGDFVFVNMVDWDTKLEELKVRAAQGQPINRWEDGFKGFFKIQSIRQILQVDPRTGAKQLVFQLQAFGFTEFNNVIYFNPYLIPPGSDKSTIFVTNLSPYWHNLFKGDGLPTVQTVVSFFIQTFLGIGVPLKTRKAITESISEKGKAVKADFNFNTQFYVPQMVGNLLGQNNAQAAKDLYVYLMGIQQYSGGTQESPLSGFIPSNLKPSKNDPRFYITDKSCQGRAYTKPDYWNQVPAWSIIKQYVNEPINEIYTCFRIAPNGLVMPTLVMRQMTYTSEKYEGMSTKFLSVPRWKVPPEMIFGMNIGRDEALRINFVQVFGFQTGTVKPDLSLTHQIAKENFALDEDDIKRSGLRPWVISSNFDVPPIKKGVKTEFTMALAWKNLMADAVIGQHLKLNGSVSCVGIQDPIAVGDNFELGDVVYQIESVTHTASILENGQRIFNTNLDISHGVGKNSNKQKTEYAQMANSKMALELQNDFQKDAILPGISGVESNYKKGFDSKPEQSNQSFDLPEKLKKDPKVSLKKKKDLKK